MRPGSLHRACAWRIARSLVNAIWHLSITELEERKQIIEVLKWFINAYGDVIFSKVMQDQLYKTLIAGLRSRRNPPLCFTTMLVLCPKVTIDQIAVIEDRHGLPPPMAGTGLDITSEECTAILDIILALKKRTGDLSPTLCKEHCYVLPTKSLVLEGVYVHDPDFLPMLFKEMPDLRHIEFQYNGTPAVLGALSRHCRELESLCFLEPRMEVSLVEKDVWPVLFGFPSHFDLRIPSLILSKFAQEEEFRKKFVFQFPNLRKLDLDELYFEEEILHDVYILALVLQPKLTCFGKHTGLTRRVLSKYRQLWKIINPNAEMEINIHLTKAKFVDSVYDDPSDADLELRYLKEIIPMFKALKSIELQKSYWNESEVARFCHIFAKHVDAFSLSDLPLNEISCLSSITHLRLTFMRQYSFEHVHLILDNCPNLKTLSIHSVFQEYMQMNQDNGQPMQRFGLMMDEDRQMLENLLRIDELLRDDLGVPANNPGVPRLEAAADPRPDGAHERIINKPKYKVHHKLLTLRIASLIEASKDPSEAFLLGLLERVPNLRNLCLGMWMGALSHRRNHLTCAANALVNVVTGTKKSKYLLANLEQLCCLPSGTEQAMCRSLALLAEALPAIRTLVVPALDTFLLTPTMKYFQHSSINIQHKCATDQVFSHWEPEH